jgi:hypothetical protein
VSYLRVAEGLPKRDVPAARLFQAASWLRVSLGSLQRAKRHLGVRTRDWGWPGQRRLLAAVRYLKKPLDPTRNVEHGLYTRSMS